MKSISLAALLGVTLSALLPSAASAQAPVINSVVASGSSIGKYEKQELSVTLTAQYTNPYDYDEVLVRGIFTAPSGRKDTMEGFYMEDYTLNATTGNITPNGTNNFRVRYAPTETGAYSYVVTCRTSSGTATSASGNFEATASGKKGFVRKNATNYLSFDNGEQYIPIGQNQAWQQSNKYLDYKKWTDRLAANKANFIRLWQAWWGLGVEWTGTPYNGLKRYSQVNAFYTDKLLEECNAKDIYMMLCINHHGMVSTTVNPEWNTNPYNKANGGPCNNTSEYFTNATAKNLHKNRLRYIVARWGYSRNIMSWELFNEVDWTDNFKTHKTAVKDWHLEMAAYLKSIDPLKHLVTTSYADNSEDPTTWNATNIDFTQTHIYSPSANVESVLAETTRSYLTQYSKPNLNGEYGINTAQANFSTIDPNGIHIHNSVWATLFSGGMGAGATWWWDNYIDPQNLYTHYKAPAIVASGIQLVTHDYKPVAGTVSGGGNADATISPGFGWGRAPAAAFRIDASGGMTPSSASLGQYLYAAECKSSERNPPTFTVTFPVASQFKITTADVSTYCAAQKVQIKVDGVEVLNSAAAAHTTYSVNVPAGNHTITVDNTGGDWIRVSSYTFTNIGSALNTYLLKSSNNSKAAGWIHNKKYNWVQAGPSGSAPAAVAGSTIHINGMANGNYEVKWYECVNGTVTSTTTVAVTGGILSLPAPSIAWDAAFTAFENSVVTSTPSLGTANGIKIYPNPAYEQLHFGGEGLPAKKYQATIYDNLGNRLLSKMVILHNNSAAPSLSVKSLPAGVYYLQLYEASGKQSGSVKFNKR